MLALGTVGILTENQLAGYNGGYIQFLGYTPETEERMEQERLEYITAHRQWQARQSAKTGEKRIINEVI